MWQHAHFFTKVHTTRERCNFLINKSGDFREIVTTHSMMEYYFFWEFFTTSSTNMTSLFYHIAVASTNLIQMYTNYHVYRFKFNVTYNVKL